MSRETLGDRELARCLPVPRCLLADPERVAQGHARSSFLPAAVKIPCSESKCA